MSLPPLINDSGYKRIWCPLCEKEQAIDGGVTSIWLSPAKVLVGYYGVCKECSGNALKLPKRLMSATLDRVEQRLIVKYPQILSKLPNGYIPATPE